MGKPRGNKGIFQRFVEPYLKSIKKRGGTFRGVLKGKVHKMPRVEIQPDFSYTKRTDAAREALRDKFNSTERKEFLKSLTESELKRHGFDRQSIEIVRAGGVPPGYQVHHKASLDDSGTNAPDNLVLIRLSPEHHLINNHQRFVTSGMNPGETKKVPWPVFPPGTRIWPPYKTDTTTTISLESLLAEGSP